MTSLRKLCPNWDNECGLDTVLEVPIPEEMYTRMGSNADARWQNMCNVVRATQRTGGQGCGGGSSSGGPTMDRVSSYAYLPITTKNDQFMTLVKLVGSALMPSQIQCDDDLLATRTIDPSIEISTAKYIVQQYLAATGGLAVLNRITSMYAVGQVEMNILNNNNNEDEYDSIHNSQEDENGRQDGDVGGFVIWQKNPDLWFLELVVSGYKISGGCDGTVSWNQSSTNSSVSKGPPRPLRRLFQGLDPRSTSHLFLNGVCIGEKKINGEDSFVVKIETSLEVLKSQSTTNTEVIRHTIWGNFSQKTGLLIRVEDTKLVRMKNGKEDDDSVFWETNMVTILEDYRYIEDINIAHRGKTRASIYRYGDTVSSKWRVQENWNIEEVDFNICGLSMDCFLTPADDVKMEKQNEQPSDNKQ